MKTGFNFSTHDSKKKVIRGLLIDLDGVIYNDSAIIPGAVNVINELLHKNIPFRFITNTTMKSRSGLVKKLAGFGINVSEKQIFSAVYAASVYLRKSNIKSCHLIVLPDARAEFQGFDTDVNSPDAVVVGDLGDQIRFDDLNIAFQKILKGAFLLALQKNRYWLSDKGYTLDAGAFVAALEYAAQTEAVIVGKPSQTFFEMALYDLGLQADEVVMIGDDLESDISGAQALGIPGILVKTGKFRQKDLDESDIIPWHVMGSIRELFNLDLKYTV